MIVTTFSDGLSINVNLLQVFLHVAESRSFKDAAARSGRSTSAVSTQVRQLEEQLSLRLFYRTTRSVELTREGEDLVEIARRSLKGLKEDLSRLRKRGAAGASVSIACAISIAGSLLPPIVKAFSARRPDVKLSVSELSLVHMTDRLLDGDFDLGIAAQYPFHPALEFEPLVKDPLVALIPASMPQSQWDSISLAELCGLPMLLMTSESVTQKTFKAAAEAAGLTFKLLFDGSLQTTLLFPLIDSGLGASVFGSAGRLWAPYPNIRAVPIREPDLSRTICLVTARGRKLPEATRQLLPLIRREAARWAAHAGLPQEI